MTLEAKLEMDEENYVESFRPHMMDVVHAWSNGCTFSHICSMTDVFEGKSGSTCLKSDSSSMPVRPRKRPWLF